MDRYLPPHDELLDPSELLTAKEFVDCLNGHQHLSTVRRWTERGVLVTREDGTKARLILPHRKAGQTLLFSVAWYLSWIKEQTRLRELALARGHESAPAKPTRTRKSKPASPKPQAPAILNRYGLSSQSED